MFLSLRRGESLQLQTGQGVTSQSRMSACSFELNMGKGTLSWTGGLHSQQVKYIGVYPGPGAIRSSALCGERIIHGESQPDKGHRKNWNQALAYKKELGESNDRGN